MAKFPIGVMSDCLRLPFAESIAKSHEIGAQGVQIFAVSGDMAPENQTPATIAEKRRIFSENGIQLSALCGDFGGRGFAVAEDNPLRIERSKRIVDLALELGGNIVTTHIGVIPEDTTCDTYKVMQEACNKLAEYAHQNGAWFAVETGPETAVCLRTFLDSLDCKGVGVNLDPANLVMITGDDPVAAVHTLAPYIVHTHAKDGIMVKKADPRIFFGYLPPEMAEGFQYADYFQEKPLGQGHVDFDAYLKALNEIGYTGYHTIEREVGDDPAADIQMAVQFLKSKM
ncbi:MAG: sugar phosphate isomerase/epimerase [Clostridia bacterium]|nr:sugar phosphate isomerase/epimerase [Clostridia bacterium]